jgi:Kef-type K+ transport system membrane component KefB
MSSFLQQSPLAIFALLLGLSVLVPPLVRQLGLPDLVGLLVAGVLVGPHALGWISANSETVQLLSDVGVIYLLFIAGLEIDLAEFARIRQRSFRFGLLTFALPMLGGLLLGLGFGYSLLSSVLLGSILSSHTPLGYPIVRSYGAVREESVVVAIGGTIFTDIAALVVLALAVGLGRGELSLLGGLALLLKVGIYAAAVVLVIQRLGRRLVRRSANNDSQLFVLVLLAVFLAALAAELAGVEKIVGAFLAGLAVNAVLPEGRVKEQVIFVGASLFIPVFFIDLGLLLDLPAFLSALVSSVFALMLIATLISSKALAAWLAGQLYGYRGAQVLTLWSLSLPQVAATLAASFVGVRAGLLDTQVLNAVLALMVVTATLGPALTGLAMRRLGDAATSRVNADSQGQLAVARRALRVLVPLSNPASEAPLLAAASLLIGGEAGQTGQVLPLAVVPPRQGGMGAALAQARGLLREAEALGAEHQMPYRSLLRIDSDVAGGIAHTAQEQGADLVLMGMAPPARLGRWLFGDLVDATCRQASCPVVVARLLQPPHQCRRLLVPVKDLTAGALEQFQLAERLASANGGSITLLHLHDPWLAAAERELLDQQLRHWCPGPDSPAATVPVSVRLEPRQVADQQIVAASQQHELVILRSQRRLVAGLPIPASDRVSRVLRRLHGSCLVISDPLQEVWSGTPSMASHPQSA